MKGGELSLGPGGNQEKLILLNVHASNNLFPNFWQRRDDLLRREKAWLKAQNPRNTVSKAREKKTRRKGRTRQDKDTACWPAWSTSRMQAHTVIETKLHKALGAQLLLNKQIPWTGDIFLEGIFVAQTFLLSSGSPGKPKPPLHDTWAHTHTKTEDVDRPWLPSSRRPLVLCLEQVFAEEVLPVCEGQSPRYK